MEGAVKVGMDISIASPIDIMPNQEIVAKAIEACKITGSKISIIRMIRLKPLRMQMLL